MAALANSKGISRLEEVVLVLAEGQVSLEKIVAYLATSMRLGFDQMAAQQRLTTEHMRQTDDCIGKLVVAIGQFIQRDRN